MTKAIQEAKLVFSLSRLYIQREAPYICKTVYGLIPHYIEGLREIARGPLGVTEGMILIMDPHWVASLTPEQFGGPVYHEVTHVVKDHLPRISSLVGPSPSEFEMYIANLAADFTSNPWLSDHGWWLPDGAGYPKDYDLPNDLMLEEYYHELLEKVSEDQIPSASFAAGACGGVAGNPINQELEKELDAQKGRGEADKIRIRNETILEIKEHISQKGVGTVPGSFKNLIPFVHKESITPWTEELNMVVSVAFENIVSGSTDFSLRRPSKRSYTRGIIRPGLVDYKPELVLIEDTSGSMGTEEIQTARNEEIAILQALGIDECWLIQADVDLAANPKRVSVQDIPDLKTHGRGGTDFRPALKACTALEPHPDIALYLTDGWGPAPDEAPNNMEVVWVVVPKSGGVRPADWGHLVVVSDDPEERARYGLDA